ncbi:MAG: hypothetical protein ACOCXH_05875 [Cyclobacteriaceae bacterium]
MKYLFIVACLLIIFSTQAQIGERSYVPVIAGGAFVKCLISIACREQIHLSNM